MTFKDIFCFAPLGVFLLLMVTFVRPCKLGVRGQAIWAMVLLASLAKFMIFRDLGGDAFNPDFPEHLLWVMNWAYSGAMILFALSIPALFWRKMPARAVVLPVLAWGLAGWGVWNGIRPPVVHELTLSFPDLPAELEGYRILHLTDLHVSSAARLWRTQEIVSRANAVKADLICVTGDLADGQSTDRAPDLAPIAKLVARDGVWCVTGNHEAYFDFAGWRACHARLGLKYLHGECVFPHARLALGGVDDRALARTGEADGHFSVARAFTTATNGEFRILLQHRPEMARDNARCHGVRLQLSGHTHGGVAPGMAQIVARFNKGFVRGLYELGSNAFVWVSPGAGQWAGFPVRLFNDAEMTCIILKRTPCKPTPKGV